jgi:Polysaccharide lyase
MPRTGAWGVIAGFVLLASAATLWVAAGSAVPSQAQAATASGCGVSLEPASRTVRRGGTVLLEGSSCAAGTSAAGGSAVQVKLQKRKRWATVAKGQTDAGGEFSVCAKLSLPAGAKVARLRATTPGGTGTTKVRVAKKGPSGCDGTSEAEGEGEEEGGEEDGGASYTAPPPDHGDVDCPLSEPGSTIGLTLPSSCTVVGSDTAGNADPIPFWGKIDCQTASRHQHLGSGGDAHATALGSPQGNGSFRRLTVRDGDDVYGERCELGENESYGHTTLYHEGQRRVTFMSLRLGNGINPLGSDWRTVMQMKQAQTYRNPNTSPIIEMQVRDGEWILRNSWNDLWSAPAQANAWTRFAFDITYSANPNVGSMRMYVDVNGDGDAADAGEASPEMRMATLRRETAGSGSSHYSVGQSIPDHLRAGVYQNPGYGCPSGCSVDVDNVQVVKS